MRGILVGFAIAVLAVSGSPAFSMDANEATYSSGTAPAIKIGEAGTLDTTLANALVFQAKSGQISIPYSGIKSYRYREESRFHLGVLPAIAVGLVKARAKVHYVTIMWQGERTALEVVTLETSKHTAEGLMTVLRTRADKTARSSCNEGCNSAF